MDTLQTIKSHKIIPIIRGVSSEYMIGIAGALKKGGIHLIEVTLNSPEALESIRLLAEEFEGEMKIGAGTVLDAEEADSAIAAGADFILSPTVNEETIRLTKRYGKVSIPGAFTPTEILNAYESGGDVIKVFPGNMGPQYIKDIRGPLPHIPLLPTGGINETNIQAFLSAGATGFGIGSSLVSATEEGTDESLHAVTLKAQTFVHTIFTQKGS